MTKMELETCYPPFQGALTLAGVVSSQSRSYEPRKDQEETYEKWRDWFLMEFLIPPYKC